MKTFTLKEVSKKINLKPAILKKWEEELEEYLEIPRTKQGARIYSQVEIDLLLEIKELHDKKLNTTMILQTLRGETDIKEVVAELKEEIFEIEEEIYELQDETFETEQVTFKPEEDTPKQESQEIAIVS